MTHRPFWPMLLVLIAAGCLMFRPAKAADKAARQPDPFFAFCMDTHDAKKRSLPQQAELLKELGYDGAGHLWLGGLAERLKTLDAAGLKLFQVYLRVSIAKDAKPPYDPQLTRALSLLAGRDTMLAVLITGGKPSDASGDARAVQLLGEIADAARPFGVRVALYPHRGDWLERVGDAIRVAQKADRPNVGVMFNLCHWMAVDDEKTLDPLLKEAMPRLFAVSISGSDTPAEVKSGKGKWIQPLDSGSFDMAGFLRTLRGLGYRGPIGLQCYGIPGDAREHLARSIQAWRKLSAKLAADPSFKGDSPIFAPRKLGQSPTLTPTLTPTPRPTSTAEVVPFKRLGLVKPRHAREIEASNWSIGCETLDRDYAIYANYKSWLGPLGAKKARFQAGWAKCEKRPGEYDWAWLDEAVNDAIAQGVEPWLETSYGNTIYPGGGGTGLAGGLPHSPEALAAWNNWVDALVCRYKDRVREWQVWNEPDIGRAGNSAEDYAELFMRTAEIIRRHQPDARLLALPLAGVRSTAYLEGFLRHVQSRGKLHLISQLIVHGYPENPDALYPIVAKLAQVAARYSSAIPLRQGESGAPSGKTVGALAKFKSSETIQAKWDLRRMLGDLGHDMESLVFTLMDFRYERAVHEGWNTKGLLQANPDKTVARPKQAYHAVQHVTAIFDHALARMRDFTHTASVADAIAAFGYAHKKSGDQIVTLWFSGVVPGDSNAKRGVDFVFPTARFRDPVYVDLRVGTVFSVPAANWKQHDKGCSFTAVPIYDSPILLAERTLIPLRGTGVPARP